MANPEEMLITFSEQGFLLFQLPDAEVPAATHEAVWEKAATVEPSNNIYPSVPELEQVLEAPTLHQTLKTVLGSGYRLWRHRFLHESSSKSNQAWHKDSYFGWRRMRSHRPRWVMVLYFPQDTTDLMGPTAILPGSQYFQVDHEKTTKHDPQKGEDYIHDLSTGDMKATDAQNDQARKCIDPNLEELFLTCKAGSVCVMHYDLFHRASRKLDDALCVRYMIKFQFFSVQEPVPASLRPLGVLSAKPLRLVHEETLRWIGARLEAPMAPPEASTLDQLNLDLLSQSEAARVNAAYALGRAARETCTQESALVCLREAMHHEDEALRRAASLGLMVAGPAAEASLLAVLGPGLRESAEKYVLWALGEIGTAAREVSDVLLAALKRGLEGFKNPDVGVQTMAAAAAALGLMVQRVDPTKADFSRICEHLLAAAGTCSVEGRCDETAVEHLLRQEATLSLLRACESAPQQSAMQPKLMLTLKRLARWDSSRYVMGYATEALLSLAEAGCELVVWSDVGVKSCDAHGFEHAPDVDTFLTAGQLSTLQDRRVAVDTLVAQGHLRKKGVVLRYLPEFTWEGKRLLAPRGKAERPHHSTDLDPELGSLTCVDNNQIIAYTCCRSNSYYRTPTVDHPDDWFKAETDDVVRGEFIEGWLKVELSTTARGMLLDLLQVESDCSNLKSEVQRRYCKHSDGRFPW